MTPEQREAKRQDAEATEFAMCLLMPEEMVRALAKAPLTEAEICDLAKRFEVSDVMMTVRLVSLGLIQRRPR